MKRISLLMPFLILITGCGKESYHIVYDGSAVAVDTFQARITALATIPESKNLATGFSDSLVLVWNPEAHESVLRILKHSHIINDFAVSDDGEILAIASGDKIFTVNELATGKTIDSSFMFSGPAMSMGMTSDKAYLAVGYGEGDVQIWDMEQHNRYGVFEQHHRIITGVRFRPGTHFMYTTSQDSFLYITRIDSKDSSSMLRETFGFLNCLTFSPDGKYLVTSRTDNQVRVWSVWETPENDSLTSLGWFQSDLGRVRDLCFSPDGSVIAVGGQDGNVILINRFDEPRFTEKKRWFVQGVPKVYLMELGRFHAHEGAVRVVRFSEDGSKLYTGGDDMTLKTWDVADIKTRIEEKKAELEK